MSYQEKFQIPNKFTFFDLLMTESFQALFLLLKEICHSHSKKILKRVTKQT